MILNNLHRHADRPLFHCDDGATYQYASALELSQHSAVQDTKRRLVFCLNANVPAALLGYLGLMAAGAVPVMLNANIPGSQLARLLESYRPGYMWLPQERSGNEFEARLVFEYSGYQLLSFSKPRDQNIHADLAMLLSTSGSTGSPKMVRLSHKNICSNAQAIADYLGLTSDEIPISTLQPSYTYGLSVLHSHLTQGCQMALTNRTFFDRGFWEFLKSSRATSMGCVPYQYEMLRKLRFANMELPSLRTLTQAGGRLSPELVREYASLCASRGMRFFVMYGQAEASPRMSYLSPDKACSKPDSIGQPIPGGRFWLEADADPGVSAGFAPSADDAGQLIYQGENVCMGYAEGAKDLAKGDEFGGVLKTGDLARRDADGDYYIIGRLNRFLKLFGHRVNLQDIEEELQAAGHAVACSGRDDQLDVYLCKGTLEAARSIKEHLVKRLLLTPGCLRILNLDQLPRSEAGKIKYADLPPLATGTLA